MTIVIQIAVLLNVMKYDTAAKTEHRITGSRFTILRRRRGRLSREE